jgi:hypothetical protein
VIKIIIPIFAILFSACSFKSPPNEWKYKSISSFDEYTKNYLKNNQYLAKANLTDAIKFAKQGGDIAQLATIYLGVCALDQSIGKSNKCKEYIDIKDLVTSANLSSYYSMIENKITKDEIQNLPKKYQSFITHKLNNNYKKAYESIESMPITSQFISANLIKESLSKSQIEYLIQKASFYGYKSLIIYWLEHLYSIENDKINKNKIKKRIEVIK